jgi:hypothetical protein
MRFLPLILVIGIGCSQKAEPERPQQEQAEPERVEFHEELLTKSELDQLPHVHRVDTFAKGTKPDFQIVHIQNWHFVDRKAFEADGGKDWDAFLKSVEAVQGEQLELLSRLRDDHGVKAVFLEGLTDADLDDYHKLAKALAKWKEPATDDPMSEFLRQQYREDRLRLGAAARVEGLEILPAEDAESLEAGNPKNPDFDLEAYEHREDAIVRRLQRSGHRVAVLILGGEHGLSDNMMRELEDNVAYASVQVEAHYKAEAERPGY